GGYVYWADTRGSEFSGSIRRCRLDGSGYETLVRDLTSVSSLALDADAKKMYWSCCGQKGLIVIQRANLDGTEIEDFVHCPRPTLPKLGFDPQRRFLYWALGGGRLMRVQVEPIPANIEFGQERLTPQLVGALQEIFYQTPH